MFLNQNSPTQKSILKKGLFLETLIFLISSVACSLMASSIRISNIRKPIQFPLMEEV